MGYRLWPAATATWPRISGRKKMDDGRKHLNFGLRNSCYSPICATTFEEMFLPGFYGTFHRQRAVDPVIGRLLWMRELISAHTCRNMADNSARGMPGALEATDCDSVSDDSLKGLRGNLQQGANPPALSLAEDTSHLKRLALKQKHQLTCDINVCSV